MTRNKIQEINEMFCHRLVKKIWNDRAMRKSEKKDKILQYIMIFLVLLAAFLLPAYGMKKVNQDPEADEQMSESMSEPISEPMAGYTGTIVLDPGHGGFDGGMTGSTGISEKVLNLIYAKKLAVLLEQEGYRVVLTRNTEAGLYDESANHKKAQDMQRRCAMIEAEKPLLTVSIHQNSYPQDSSVRGPQVFYYEHSAEGEKLAACIQDAMNEQLEIERPRVQKANSSYYILKRSASTTVLVEVGFLTNPEEELLLQQEEYQNRAVKAICDGILKYCSREIPSSDRR